MSFRRRTLVLALLAAFAAGAYGIARHYSPVLVAYVVEQTLLQKTPESVDRSDLKKRFHVFLDSLPDDHERLEKLFEVSQYLEKTQLLRSREIEQLLGPSDREGSGSHRE